MGVRAILVALGVLSDFAFALNNRGWAKSDSCDISLAGPAAPGGGRVSVLARRLFLWRVRGCMFCVLRVKRDNTKQLALGMAWPAE